MADSWQTIEQAAVSLGLSVRTVNRHMAAGKLQSRLNAEGRREVLVSLPDSPTTDSVSPPFSETPATDTPVETSDNVASRDTAGSLDPETVLALANNAAHKADVAVTAYQTLARVAENQVRQSRRQARFAWAGVALMAVGLTVAVGWTTHRLTRASADAGHMSDEIRQLTQQVSDGAQAVRQQSASFESARTTWETSQHTLRAELSAAREQAARAEGSLMAYKDQQLARQTQEPQTRPAPSLAEVLARILSNASDMADARLASETSMQTALPAKVETPTTRPVALRRKVAQPATRPSRSSDAPSDTSSASTDAGD